MGLLHTNLELLFAQLSVHGRHKGSLLVTHYHIKRSRNDADVSITLFSDYSQLPLYRN